MILEFNVITLYSENVMKKPKLAQVAGTAGGLPHSGFVKAGYKYTKNISFGFGR